MVQAEGGESGAQAGAEEKIGKLRRCEGWLKVAVLGWGLLMIGAVLSLAGSSIYYGATYDGPEGDWQGGSKCLGRYRQLRLHSCACAYCEPNASGAAGYCVGWEDRGVCAQGNQSVEWLRETPACREVLGREAAQARLLIAVVVILVAGGVPLYICAECVDQRRRCAERNAEASGPAGPKEWADV